MVNLVLVQLVLVISQKRPGVGIKIVKCVRNKTRAGFFLPCIQF